MKRDTITHEFVNTIPNVLVEGVLYISIPHATAIHKCCCGCGNEVVTPLSPVDWELSFNGQTVSLSPSIGNWGFPCLSHYWIRRNKVQWAGRWNSREITAVRDHETREKEDFFGTEVESDTPSGSSLWSRIQTWFGAK